MLPPFEYLARYTKFTCEVYFEYTLYIFQNRLNEKYIDR